MGTKSPHKPTEGLGLEQGPLLPTLCPILAHIMPQFAPLVSLVPQV